MDLYQQHEILRVAVKVTQDDQHRATRGRACGVSAQGGGRLCRVRSFRSLFEVGPRLDVRR